MMSIQSLGVSTLVDMDSDDMLFAALVLLGGLSFLDSILDVVVEGVEDFQNGESEVIK